MPDGQLAYRVAGVPTFTVGEEYVVFLAGVSSAGFSSPIGLGQGRFTVQQLPSGEMVTNGRDFREMTAGPAAVLLPAAVAKAIAEARAPVRNLGLDDFKQMVRARVGGAR